MIPSTRTTALLALPLLSAGVAHAWSPDAPLDARIALAQGRWSIAAPSSFTADRERSDAAVVLASEDRRFVAVLREIYLRDDGGGAEAIARDRCEAPLDGPTVEPLGGRELWSVRCAPFSDAGAAIQVDRWWYVTHLDGLLLEVGGHGAESYQLALLRRMLATLEPAPDPTVPRTTSVHSVQLDAPPGYAAWRSVGIDWHVMHVAEIAAAREEAAELRVSLGSTVAEAPAREGARRWAVPGTPGWMGERWQAAGEIGAHVPLLIRCDGDVAMFVQASALAPDEARFAHLERALSSLRVSHESSRCRVSGTLAPARSRRSTWLWLLLAGLGVALLAWAAYGEIRE